ncbi:MAG: T9SS type A sorting domain-containing protein [Flammeovirgaceae bacterium]
MKAVALPVLMLVALKGYAQFTYSIDHTIPVEANGNILAMPWAGGLNAAQVNTMDLNGDNKQDLVIFDRTTSQVLTFINQNSQYTYAPEYESQFPSYINQWLLLRDINCDGKKDIFTSDPFGLVAFINTTQPGQPLSWRPFNKNSGNNPQPLLTIGSIGNINLKINADDVPAIDDIDGDGDLDILNMRFVSPNTVEWHRNMTKENVGRCDSMQFKRETQNWGGFEECTCGKISLPAGKTCAELLAGGRTQHSGGKALLPIDFNNDGVKDLLFTEESCANLYLLNNTGTISTPLITSFATFPAAAPVAIPFYPAAFFEDVTFDGTPDLLLTANLSARNSALIDFQRSLTLLRNTGTSTSPQFTNAGNNFLQSDMIDVGDNSVPAFFDMDGDGDLDLLVSNNIRAGLSATIAQYENVGTNPQPSFKLVTDDYLFFSVANYTNIKIQFADVNADGNVDLALTANTNRNSATSTLFYLANSASDRFRPTDPTLRSTNFRIGNTENLLLVDVDQNGALDILVGNDTGAIEYWKNQGPPGSLNFTLAKADFLGIGNSTDRQNLAMTASDLDSDGLTDLAVANQRGEISIYSDFRSQNTAINPVNQIVYNELTQKYEKRNFGGNCWPTSANLFNSNRPTLVVGNTRGGLYILKNDGGKELPPDPAVVLFPNPVVPSQAPSLKIISDRNVKVQVYNLLGQGLSDVYLVPGNQEYEINVGNLSAGMYVARFSWNGKIYAKKFVVQ